VEELQKTSELKAEAPQPNKGRSPMLLRDHPLMYKGNRKLPPAWLWTAGYDTTHPIDEVEILKAGLHCL
jgi:hypothetical protein